jgi:hypothetical protein
VNPGRRRRLQRTRRHRKAVVRQEALMNMDLTKLKPYWKFSSERVAWGKL